MLTSIQKNIFRLSSVFSQPTRSTRIIRNVTNKVVGSSSPSTISQNRYLRKFKKSLTRPIPLNLPSNRWNSVTKTISIHTRTRLHTSSPLYASATYSSLEPRTPKREAGATSSRLSRWTPPRSKMQWKDYDSPTNYKPDSTPGMHTCRRHRSTFQKLQRSSLRGRYVTNKKAGTLQKCVLCFPVLDSKSSRQGAKIPGVVDVLGRKYQNFGDRLEFGCPKTTRRGESYIWFTSSGLCIANRSQKLTKWNLVPRLRDPLVLGLELCLADLYRYNLSPRTLKYLNKHDHIKAPLLSRKNQLWPQKNQNTSCTLISGHHAPAE